MLICKDWISRMPLYSKNDKMDHLRISGTEPSLVILSQTKKFEKM